MTTSQEDSFVINNLSKRYEIYSSPRDRLKQFFLPRLKRLFGKNPGKYYRDFWALKDISFAIKKGETVGIIGRNGAGKSTLLQIVCGTLSPTEGEVQINGRVAALLELGSGFNSDFTGRENIYMNASILGLSKSEIDDRFKAIVEFADIGDFLDQPVKTYSSGMYVRLAFAVVVHVSADVLIVDEALSVGDAYFQAKCMVKMKELMASGVTVLFVSHDVGAIKSLCQRAIFLENGKIVAIGETDDVVNAYYSAGIKGAQSLKSQGHLPSTIQFTAGDILDEEDFQKRASFHRIQNEKVKVLNVTLLDNKGVKSETISYGETLNLRVKFKASEEIKILGMAYHIRDKNGIDVVYSDTGIERCHFQNVKSGESAIMDWRFNVHLREGSYTISIMLSIPQDLTIGKIEVCDFVPIAATFNVTLGKSLPIYGSVHWENQIEQQRFLSP